MLLKQNGQSIEIYGNTYTVGMLVVCTDFSDYEGLYGKIIEIDGDAETETFNITCKLFLPYSKEKIALLEQKFAATADNIELDRVIMSPEMVISADDTISNAIEKLSKEANSSGGQNVPAIPIYEHLKKVCESDIVFADAVIQPHKTLQKCFSYVYEQVKNTVANGANSVWVADNDVYNMSEDYYHLDDAEIERRKEEEKKKRDKELAKKKIECGKQTAAKKTVQQTNNTLADGQIMFGMDDESTTDTDGETGADVA